MSGRDFFSTRANLTKMYLSILIISLFAFVMSMIGTLKSYFGRRWQWFLLILLCVLVSGTCTTIELY